MALHKITVVMLNHLYPFHAGTELNNEDPVATDHGNGYCVAISDRILLKAVSLVEPHRSRHINSSRYDGRKDLCTPFILLIFDLHRFQ